MAIVYLWDRLGPTGHVSVEFAHQGQSSRYTSWHPANADPKYLDAFEEVPGEFKDGTFDRTNHPRGHSHYVQVDGLDEQAMLDRHVELKQAAQLGKLKYCLRTTNCARIAADVLSHGKHHGVTFLQHLDVVRHRLMEYRDKRIPHNVPDVLQDASKTASVAFLRAHPLLRATLALPMLTEALCWSPRDVIVLADLFNGGHF